ncbi:MAG: ParB/RepB/Spo0J family partition protein [Kiloniellales bacterium]|nr:ParB/RepB/Spo0J family partition protein [Kiloniellales bacterium]
MASEQRTNLGRGLAALFGEEDQDYADLDRVRASKQVPVGNIHPNPKQPRRHFDTEAIQELANSIRENGILQPIVVRRHPERPSDFEIVAGERRWRAAQLAQLHDVPVIIRELSDQQCLEIALVENVQRQDLNPLEEAAAYERLIQEFEYSQEALAVAVGKSRSHVANTLRLLSLPAGVKTLVADGRISAGHARALLTSTDPEAAAKKVLAEGMSVRQAEDMAREDSGRRKRPKQKKSPPKDPDTAALERDLTALLGMKVTVDFQGEGGRLSIFYRSVEQLDDLLKRFEAPATTA